MDFFEHIIIGSGPAGVSAALKLEGPNTCVVDVANKPASDFPYSNLKEALASGQTENILGNHWEMLSNLSNPLHCHPKLRAQTIRHVMQGEEFQVTDSANKLLVQGRGSFAAGGMANVWGAQLLRYNDDDLSEVGDWPILASELTRHYNDLESHIGISGVEDDMSPFLGPTNDLLPPIPGVPVANYMLDKYYARRSYKSEPGLRIGRPRLALLTQAYNGRSAYNFGETEFFTPAREGIYNPLHTLEELLQRDKIHYLGGHKLISFQEHQDYVEIQVEVVKTHEKKILRTKHLLLGCGTIQTTRLVLLNQGKEGLSLPFIDHPPTLLPVFFPASFGSKLPQHSYPIQLIGTLENGKGRDMMSFYFPAGMLWSDLLPDIPLPMNIARSVLSSLIGGMLVAQIWETSRPSKGNRMHVKTDGTVKIEYNDRQAYSKLPLLLTELRKLGGFSLDSLASAPPPSWGFHHAATLPMRINPKPFETHTDGRLWDSRRIRVIDGSVLPSLPAKNHSLTIMANSARISEQVKLCGY